MSTLPTPRTREGRAALAAVIADPGVALVALDYDGTLAPIVDRPEDAVAHPRAASALRAIASAGTRVAIVTGRPAGEAVRLGGLADVPKPDRVQQLAVGGHGELVDCVTTIVPGVLAKIFEPQWRI